MPVCRCSTRSQRTNPSCCQVLLLQALFEKSRQCNLKIHSCISFDSTFAVGDELHCCCGCPRAPCFGCSAAPCRRSSLQPPCPGPTQPLPTGPSTLARRPNCGSEHHIRSPMRAARTTHAKLARGGAMVAGTPVST